MKTQISLVPPRNIDNSFACADDWSDEIRELGDQIANLTLGEARQLSLYLKTFGIKSLKTFGIKSLQFDWISL